MVKRLSNTNQNNNKLENVSTPVNSNDAANKQYVDDKAKTIDVTVTTAQGTAAKIGTTSSGNYVPQAGDRLRVNFVNGSSVNSPTLNIDGSGAYNIRLGNANVNANQMGLGNITNSNVEVQMWFDGTYYRIYGIQTDQNTTYSEIPEAEITAGTASTARAITGRRAKFIQDSTKAVLVQDTPPTDTNKLWYDTSVDTESETLERLMPLILERLMPVGHVVVNTFDDRNPNEIYGFGMWIAITDRFIYGAGSKEASTTGGSETHTLTIAEMPSHYHEPSNGLRFATSNRSASASERQANPTTSGTAWTPAYGSGDVIQHPAYTNSVGSGEAHNNMPPYLVAYIWERVE